MQVVHMTIPPIAPKMRKEIFYLKVNHKKHVKKFGESFIFINYINHQYLYLEFRWDIFYIRYSNQFSIFCAHIIANSVIAQYTDIIQCITITATGYINCDIN